MRPRSMSAKPSLGRQANQIKLRYASVASAGRCIARRYRLEELLHAERLHKESGDGSGMSWPGNVWRARQLTERRPVAIKFLDPAIAMDAALLDGFLGDVRAASALSSEHAAEILDCGVESGTPYFVMELLEGETLQQRLARQVPLEAPLDVFFSEACEALHEAHGLGIVHRDLKPANLFLVRRDGRETAKLVFGIAKLISDTLALARRMANHAIAPPDTVAYMSPEQVLGKSTLDHRSDIWSLAVMAFECMTGQLPFPGVTLGDRLVSICTATPLLPSDLGPVPPGFDAWFMRGVNKVPAERFESAIEMSGALRRVLAA